MTAGRKGRSIERRIRLVGGTTGVGTGLGVALGAGVAGWTQGGWAPAIGGAFGGVASLFGAVVLDQRLQRDAERENARKARDGALSSLEPDPRAAAGALTLLRAGQCPIRFYGRVTESAMLARWDVSPVTQPKMAGQDRHPVIVITGDAGVGKSRLAYQHGLDLPVEWARGEIRPGRGGDAVRLAREAGDPTLIIVDDGEGNPDLPPLLEELAEHSGKPLIRVLVTARSLEGVRSLVAPRLQERHRHLLEHAPSLPLAPQGEIDDRRRWFGEAVTAFAGAQGIEPPHVTGHVSGEGDRPDEAILVLFAQALLTVLNAAATHDQVPDARTLAISQVARALFDHEKARWSRSPLLPDGLDEVAQARVVAALMLQDIDSEEAAVTALQAVPDLSDASQERLRRIARWASNLYPAGPGFTVDLRPDLLADWFILDQLNSSPELVRSLAQELEGGTIELMLRRLARAANRDSQAISLFTEIVQADPTRLLVIAVRAALSAGRAVRALDQHLALMIKSVAWDSGDLITLRASLPLGLLLHSAVESAAQQVIIARKSNDLTKLANSLNILTNALGNLGRHHEQLPIAQEVVSLRRSLATDDPAYLPGLADSLNNLSVAFGNLGRHHEQLPIAQEVVSLRRSLATDDPAYLPGLASSLSNLSLAFGNLGRHHERLPAAQEAVSLYRSLSTDNPAHLPGLANSLNNLSVALRHLGRHHERLPAAQEAVSLYRSLSTDNPAHLPGLANSLNNLSVALGSLGRHHERLLAAQEAVSFHRFLAADNPAHPDALANGLDNLGNALGDLGRYHERLPITQEAVSLYRSLSTNNPAHLNDLARSLDNLGVAFGSLGNHREQLLLAQKAVSLWRSLATENPAYLPDLASSLNNLSATLGDLDRHHEDLPLAQEAVSLYRSLTTDNPAHADKLAYSLDNLGITFDNLGRSTEALNAKIESVALFKDLAHDHPDLYGPIYRELLARLRKVYSEHGLSNEALLLHLSNQEQDHDQNDR
ncbi:tetratricopeptide repeat protein [Streptosporangium sp. LJ11]|uniref:tetratricopeptide repeat protein n=1 Tax=Streptosporangium sp. LJ11 TaxID=3436927 RepID=UPI003F798EFC